VGWLVVVGLVAGVLAVAPRPVAAAIDPGVSGAAAPEVWCSSSQRVALEDPGFATTTSSVWTDWKYMTV
jgi:hypothetical protein